MPRFGAVEIDDMDNLAALGVPGYGLIDGFLREDGFLVVISLDEIDAEASSNIDGGDDMHGYCAVASFALTTSTMALKRSVSVAAISASIFRLISMLAILRPAMNLL